MRYRISIDVGGTFTDIILYDPLNDRLEATKELTTPINPINGIIRGITRLKINYEDIDWIVHATTLGTNMLFGQMNLKPPKVLLITNRGFIDILEIGRQNRPSIYNPNFTRSKPLIPRNMRIGIKGRLDSQGNIIEDLDPDEIRGVISRYCNEVDVYAIVLLHSYINPIHEVKIRELIIEECPKSYVVLSSNVDPQPKEYERSSTTVLNAILKPVLSSYLKNLHEYLCERGFKGRLMVMKSDGGISSIEGILERPAAFIESGPAAGAVATAYISRILDLEYALGFDMGGTTAKASSIIDGKPSLVYEYEVGGETHMGRIIRGS